MIRHVSLFSFTGGATPEICRTVREALERLPGLVPEIRQYIFGPDLGVNDGNFDYAVVADFDDIEGYIAYRDHPEHRRVLREVIAPVISARSAAQLAFEHTSHRG